MTTSRGIGERIDYLAGPAYFLALQLVFLPIVDFLANVWPVDLADVSWRYGAIGLFSGFLLTPLLGFVMALVTAATAGHRRVLRTVGLLAVVSGVLLLLSVPLFALDVLQLRGSVNPEARGQFEVGAIKAAVKDLFGAVGLVWMGVASIRASGRMPASASPEAVLVGRSGPKN